MKNPNNHFQKVAGGLLCLMAGLLLSCQEGDLDIGLPIAPDQLLSIHEIDTLTVKLSTVYTDTVITSSSGRILAGRMAPSQGGLLEAHGYFQLDPPPGLSSIQRVQFDSLVLFLRYTASAGDTTQLQTLKVHTLSSLPSTTRLYSNISNPGYNPVPLGQKTFRAHPTRDSVLAVRLSDELGLQLRDLMSTNTSISQEMINRLLYGLAVLPGADEKAAILSFDASQSFVRFYYREEESAHSTYAADLPLRSGYTQFNSFRYLDTSREAINSLDSKGEEVASSGTNHEVLIQLGVGLQTKLEIPYLQVLKHIENYAGINRVVLEVQPIRKSLRDRTPPPATLVLQVINRSNQVLGDLLDFNGTAVTANYQVDLTELTLTDSYTFDLTDYFINVLNGSLENKGLLITVPSGTDNGSAVEGVSFGDAIHPTDRLRLSVYYTAGH
jgi:hypothetical protein